MIDGSESMQEFTLSMRIRTPKNVDSKHTENYIRDHIFIPGWSGSFASNYIHVDRYQLIPANKQCPHKELAEGGNLCHSEDGCEYQLFGADTDPTFCGEDEIRDLQQHIKKQELKTNSESMFLIMGEEQDEILNSLPPEKVAEILARVRTRPFSGQPNHICINCKVRRCLGPLPCHWKADIEIAAMKEGSPKFVIVRCEHYEKIEEKK